MGKERERIMTKIYLDAGHGGTDPGAVANGLREKDLTLKIAFKIRDILNGYNCSVRMSRTDDKTVTLSQRTNDANAWGANFFLSVHINSGGGTGYEDYIYNKLSDNSHTARIRDVIHSEIVKSLGTGVRNRGRKKSNFHVLRETKMDAMLTENLFIDTKADADLLKSEAFLNKVAQGHANGLIKVFGLKRKTSPNPSGELYRVQVGAFKHKENAERLLADVKKRYPDAFITS